MGTNFKYDGLMLTTLHLEPEDDKDRSQLVHGDKVRFTEKAVNAKSQKAAFLNNIEEVEDGVFTAKFISNEEAAKIARHDEERTTLFCVHGLSVEAGAKLGKVLGAHESFAKKNVYYPIPVIWATLGHVLGYWSDRKRYAPEAGGILKTIANDIPDGDFGKISLMCHSLGNHLVFNNAGLTSDEKPVAPKVKFQNIFMVAADVPSDIFTENPNQGYFGIQHKKEKAENMKMMLDDGGKIYVLYNKNDKALLGSKIFKFYNFFQKRLGSLGAYEIRKDFEGFVMNFDTTEIFEEAAKKNEKAEKPDALRHGYHYYDWTVDFYNSAGGKDTDRSPDDRVEKPSVYDYSDKLDGPWCFGK